MAEITLAASEQLHHLISGGANVILFWRGSGSSTLAEPDKATTPAGECKETRIQ